MSTSTLSPSSYVILGLLATCGPATPYELKKLVDTSVGYFWSFPRAQLYVEPERLASLGLLSERREEGGRHRRVYSVTDAGRAALMEWLTDETAIAVELRDAGLLKLHFSGPLGPERIVRMARAQAELHRQRLAEYERIATEHASGLEAIPPDLGMDTLRMGLRYERISIEFWEEEARRAQMAADAPQSREDDGDGRG
jgi:DNA-binding PadR family transcriptional regulator